MHIVKYLNVPLTIQHQSFVYTQLNDKTVLFQTIQFSISHLFALSLNVKQFYLTHRYNNPIRWYQSRPEWQWRGTLHSQMFQNYWSLTIRLFNIISRTLVGGELAFGRDAVGIFYSPSWMGWYSLFYSDIP